MNTRRTNNYIVSKDGEKQLRFILELSNNLGSASEPLEIYKLMTKATREYFKSDRCYYNEMYGDRMVVRWDSSKGDMESVVGEYNLGLYPQYKGLVGQGNPIVVNNVHIDGPVELGLKNSFIGKNIIAYIGIPIKRNNEIVGLISICQSQERKWTGAEVRLAVEVGNNTWNAVERAKLNREKEKIMLEAMEERDKLKAIIESMDAEVWIMDNKGIASNFKSGNLEGLPVFPCKVSPKDIWSRIRLCHMDGSPIPKEELPGYRALEGKTLVGEVLTKYLHNNKQTLHEYRASPIINKDGHISGSVVLLTNISKRKAMEKELIRKEELARALVEELEKVDQLRLGFLSSLSHELRNPLATIDLAIGLMDYVEDNIEEQRRTRQTLKRQTKQLIKLVDDLLDMARITQNKFELVMEETKLNSLVKELVEDGYPNFEKKKVELEIIMCEEELTLMGDRHRLIQAIENILSNALRFSLEKGKVTVRLDKDQAGKEALISIKDRGKGIPKDIGENIFKPYVQARNDQGKSLAGLGIGLSLVKEIVEKHRGSIKVISEGENKGTEVIIRLPII